MNRLWLIKDKKGRILGPYSEEEILSFIEEGRFKGQEFCATYPSGKWKLLSTNSLFYDKILNILNKKEEKREVSKEISYSEDDEEVLEPTLVLPSKEKKHEKKKQVKIKIKDFEDEDEEFYDESSDIIEMEDVRSHFFHKLKKGLIIPLFLIASIALATFVILNNKPSKKNYQVRLLTVQKKSPPLSSKEVAEKFKKALGYYAKDQMSFYLKSQLQLIQILEGNPEELKSYAHLCLIYLEIWPFSYQDTKDKRSFSKTLNLINKKDKGGVFSGICNVVQSIRDNKYKKARMIIDSSINGLREENPVFLYYLKALAFKKSKKNSEAKNYLNNVNQLYPQWIAPYMLSAEISYQEKQYHLAIKKYQKVLSIFPGQVSAQLRLGILEYKYLKNIEKSKKRLKTVLNNMSEILNPQILLESYKTLMQISIKQQDTKNTLFYAKKVYTLNPSDNEVAALIARLGNKDILESINVSAQNLIYQGDLLVSEGNCNEAQNFYKEAYSAKTQKNALAAIRIAKCLWQGKISGQAIQWLKRSVAADPKMTEAYFLLVDYMSTNYDFESAKEILRVAQKRNPNSYEIFKGYALLAFRQKQYKAAIAYGQRALKMYSSDIELYSIMNKSYRALGDYNEAYLYAKKAIEEDINNVSGQIGYALALGSAYGFPKGEAYLKRLVQRFPLVVEYSEALGKYYFEDEKYDEAKNTFLFLYKNYPQFKTAYIYLGRIYGFIGHRDNDRDTKRKALQFLLKASLLDISDPEPLFYIGWIYMKNEQYHEAENQYEKILSLNSKYPLIHYYIGKVNFLQGGDDNLDRALKAAKIESQKNPNLSLGYVLEGDIYKKKALSADHSRRKYNYELCAKAYQKAIKLQNKNIEFYVELISCYRGSGDFDSALQIANQIIEREGTSGYPEMYRQLGYIYETKGDYERAQQIYNDYFSLMPRAPDRKEIEDRMKSYILKEARPSSK